MILTLREAAFSGKQSVPHFGLVAKWICSCDAWLHQSLDVIKRPEPSVRNFRGRSQCLMFRLFVSIASALFPAILIVAALRARNRLKPGLRTTLRTVCRVRSPGFSRSEPKMRSAAKDVRLKVGPQPDAAWGQRPTTERAPCRPRALTRRPR